MTLTQLRAFVAIMESGSFTSGASRTGMSQPAISDLIRRLERELETALFRRVGRGVEPTSAGTDLLPYAKQSLAAAEEGQRAVRAAQALEGGTATFGLLANAPFYMTENLANEFRALHPAVRIRLTGQNSAETAAEVRDGKIEAALVTLPVDSIGLETYPLVRDELVFVSADPQRTESPTTIEALCNSPLVIYPANYGQRDPALRQLHDRAQLAARSLQATIEVEQLQTAMSLVAAGHGDSFACSASLRSEVLPRGLHYAPFAPPIYDTLALVKRTNHTLSPATRELARVAYESLLDFQRSPNSTVEILSTLRKGRQFFAAAPAI